MYELIGLPASPYSIKLRAILRYRRIPHIWTMLLPEASARAFNVRPVMLPILCAPDGGEHIDSTSIALMLEDRLPDMRSILPADPAMRFLCLLIEDFCDEWLAKLMYHYRWSFDEGAAMASRWLANDLRPAAPADARAATAAVMRRRQIDRLAMVGCREEHAPLFERDYRAVLALLSAHLARTPFLFGARPSLADFALFGQLSQLAIDPVPRRIMEAEAQDVADWVRRMDDLSGWTGTAWDDGAIDNAAVQSLLALAADHYLPYLTANELALAAGHGTLNLDIGGVAFAQPVFAFHRKCAQRLRALWAALPARAKATLDPMLSRAAMRDWLEAAA
jgi:glutathione S-transferase